MKAVETPPVRKRISTVTKVALVLVITLNIWVAARSAELFLVPPGSEIRPMAWTVGVFFSFFVGGVFLLPLAYAGFCRDESRLSRVAIGLSLLPLPLGWILLRLACFLRDLTLSP